MLKTITAYIINDRSTARLLDAEHLAQVIPEPTAADPDKTQWSRVGFSRPEHFGETTVFVSSAGARVFNVEIRERVLPGKVIRKRVSERAADLQRRQGYKPGRKQLAEIKEEAVAELLPASHVKPADILCMVTGKYLLIGTGSARLVDVVIDLLRALYPYDKLNFRMLSAGRRVQPWMTDLLLSATTPSGIFNVGGSVALKGVSKSTARFKDMDMACTAVESSVENGLKPVEISATFNDRVGFSLTDQLIVKRIRFSDILLKEVAEDTQDGGATDHFDASVALVAGEIKELLGQLESEMPIDEEDDL